MSSFEIPDLSVMCNIDNRRVVLTYIFVTLKLCFIICRGQDWSKVISSIIHQWFLAYVLEYVIQVLFWISKASVQCSFFMQCLDALRVFNYVNLHKQSKNIYFLCQCALSLHACYHVLLFFLSQSLLEHQSNPKKPLKMHFKNSMVKHPINEYLGYPH